MQPLIALFTIVQGLTLPDYAAIILGLFGTCFVTLFCISLYKVWKHRDEYDQDDDEDTKHLGI